MLATCADIGRTFEHRVRQLGLEHLPNADRVGGHRAADTRHERRRAESGVELPEGEVDDCGRREAQGDVVGVPHQPDDLDLSRLAAHAGRQTLADWIRPGEILLRERFVHDHHRLAAGRIALAEVAAGDQARLHRFEESRAGADDDASCLAPAVVRRRERRARSTTIR